MFVYAPTSFSLFSFSVNAVGHLGYATGDHPKNKSAKRLTVPWHDTLPGTDALSLLSWHTRTSPFRGREREMAELEEWALSEPAVRAKFVIAEGGEGKSRLGAEFAERMHKKKKWAAGVVKLRQKISFRMHRKGTLLVIDYPEEHVTELKELFKDLAELDNKSKLRILLLTRQNYSAWEEIIDTTGAHELCDATPLNLAPLDTASVGEIFNATAQKADETINPNAKGKADNLLASQDAIEAWINADVINQRPLFAMAAAVNSAHSGNDPELKYSGKAAVIAVAKREAKRYTGIAEGQNVKTYALARAKAITAITGPLSFEQLVELENKSKVPLGFGDAGARDRLRHTGLLSKGDIVPILHPDILAAAFLVEVLSRRPEYAEELLWAALAMDIESGLKRFGRLCHDAEHVLGLLGFRLSGFLAKSVDGQIDRARSLEPHLREPDLPLGCIDVAVAVGQTMLPQAKDDEEKSRLLTNFSLRLGNIGNKEQALITIREAVNVDRRLAEKDPERFEPELGISLNNLGNWYSELGRLEEALSATSEAVEIRRELARHRPEAFLPALAMSLNNLGIIYSALGRREEALAATLEAVDTYRELVSQRPETYLAELATSLSNVGIRYSALGRREEALAATLEAVDTYRELVSQRPEAYLPNLAMSINNLGNRYSELGRLDEALSATSEAVGMYRELAKHRPEAFLPALAMCHGALGSALREAGEIENAIRSFQTGAELVQLFAERYPGSSLEELFQKLVRDVENTKKMLPK